MRFNKRSSRNFREGFANIVPSRDDVVEGVCYLIKTDAVSVLDVFEGVPNNYLRQFVNLRFCNEFFSSLTYFANPLCVFSGLSHSREYLSHLLAGRDLLSSEYYDWLSSVRML